eukprot:3247105-Prymnesium_polylepis.1
MCWIVSTSLTRLSGALPAAAVVRARGVPADDNVQKPVGTRYLAFSHPPRMQPHPETRGTSRAAPARRSDDARCASSSRGALDYTPGPAPPCCPWRGPSEARVR